MADRTSWTCSDIIMNMTRRKQCSSQTSQQTIRSDLNAFNIIGIMLGTFLGFGVFAIIGVVAQKITGPAILVSLVVAAVNSLLNGFCYLEFTCRFPKHPCHSIDKSMYSVVGQFPAYLSGWLKMTANIFTIALCGRTLSSTFDYIVNESISKYIISKVGFMQCFGTYPDFVASLILIGFTALYSMNCDIHRLYQFLLYGVNIFLIICILVSSLWYSGGKNWFTEAGLLPYGAKSILMGGALCFIGFTHFEHITQRTKSSQMSLLKENAAVIVIILSILLVLIGISCAILVVSSTSIILSNAPFLEVMHRAKATWLMYIIGSASFLGLMPAMLSSMTSAVEATCTLSSDGLLCECFSKNYQSMNNPLFTVITLGSLSAILTLLFDQITLMWLSTLTSLTLYTLVIIAILFLRYRSSEDINAMTEEQTTAVASNETDSNINNTVITKYYTSGSNETSKSFNSTNLYTKMKNQTESDTDNSETSSDESNPDIDAIVEEYKEKLRVSAITKFESPMSAERRRKIRTLQIKVIRWLLISIIVSCGVLAIIISYGFEYLTQGHVGYITVVATLLLYIFIGTLVLACKRELHSNYRLTLAVPLGPWVPMFTLLSNAVFIAVVPFHVTVGMLVWLLIGVLLYLTYGMRHSREKPLRSTSAIPEEEQILLQQLPTYSSNTIQPLPTEVRSNILQDDNEDNIEPPSESRSPISFKLDKVQIP